MKTTVEQREAWKKVHAALSEYYNNFGPIEVGEENGLFYLDWESEFVECGKIYCPDHRFALDKKNFPWYNWIKNKGKGNDRQMEKYLT